MAETGANGEPAQPTPICTAPMREGKPCGRPVHPAPVSADKDPFCLMHSTDPAKSDTEFQAEFDRILAEAERTGTVADFTRFVFPVSNYSRRTFAPACRFELAIFTQFANFRAATFSQDANFAYVTSTQGAAFSLAEFVRGADFRGARFAQDAGFSNATFNLLVDFREAEFTQVAIFIGTTFTQDAYFSGATFTQDADFRQATFNQDADFVRATFTGDAEFSYMAFRGAANFSTATISGAASFRETGFRHDFTWEPGLDFSDVKVEHPEHVKFYKVDLGQALFYNTDVSKMNFALVEWRDRGRILRNDWRKRVLNWSLPPILRSGKLFPEQTETDDPARRMRPGARLCIFDEGVPLRRGDAILPRGALLPPQGSADERNYSLIAETYQQLKRNYDAKGDYWTAGDWHYGEMEMKRLHSRWRWEPLHWLSHHLSLVALYKYASAYGESYLRPLAWLAFIVAAFTFLYPIPGLEFNPPTGGTPGWLGYVDWTTFFDAHPFEHPSGIWGMLLHSLMASLSVAGFQRELRYAPGYPWGRMWALFELLLTTTLGGLFLLAIRRQFKRS
jgi:uncharacterized protein YjbI with pentapeptide repeats